MRHVYLVVFLMLVSTSVAHAEQCSPSRPSVSLDYRVDALRYDRSRSVRDLSYGLNLHGHSILGSTTGMANISFQITYSGQEVSKHRYCLHATNVKALFVSRPVMSIARNLKRGSCEYHAVLMHEQEHVKILKKTHKEYMDMYRSHLRRVTASIPELPPVSLMDMNAQKRAVSDYISSEMQSVLYEITQVLIERQAKIDTREEYERVRAKCDHWDDKITNE